MGQSDTFVNMRRNSDTFLRDIVDELFKLGKRKAVIGEPKLVKGWDHLT